MDVGRCRRCRAYTYHATGYCVNCRQVQDSEFLENLVDLTLFLRDKQWFLETTEKIRERERR